MLRLAFLIIGFVAIKEVAAGDFGTWASGVPDYVLALFVALIAMPLVRRLIES